MSRVTSLVLAMFMVLALIGLVTAIDGFESTVATPIIDGVFHFHTRLRFEDSFTAVKSVRVFSHDPATDHWDLKTVELDVYLEVGGAIIIPTDQQFSFTDNYLTVNTENVDLSGIVTQADKSLFIRGSVFGTRRTTATARAPLNLYVAVDWNENETLTNLPFLVEASEFESLVGNSSRDLVASLLQSSANTDAYDMAFVFPALRNSHGYPVTGFSINFAGPWAFDQDTTGLKCTVNSATVANQKITLGRCNSDRKCKQLQYDSANFQLEVRHNMPVYITCSNLTTFGLTLKSSSNKQLRRPFSGLVTLSIFAGSSTTPTVIDALTLPNAHLFKIPNRNSLQIPSANVQSTMSTLQTGSAQADITSSITFDFQSTDSGYGPSQWGTGSEIITMYHNVRCMGTSKGLFPNTMDANVFLPNLDYYSAHLLPTTNFELRDNHLIFVGSKIPQEDKDMFVTRLALPAIFDGRDTTYGTSVYDSAFVDKFVLVSTQSVNLIDNQFNSATYGITPLLNIPATDIQTLTTSKVLIPLLVSHTNQNVSPTKSMDEQAALSIQRLVPQQFFPAIEFVRSETSGEFRFAFTLPSSYDKMASVVFRLHSHLGSTSWSLTGNDSTEFAQCKVIDPINNDLVSESGMARKTWKYSTISRYFDVLEIVQPRAELQTDKRYFMQCHVNLRWNWVSHMFKAGITTQVSQAMFGTDGVQSVSAEDLYSAIDNGQLDATIEYAATTTYATVDLWSKALMSFLKKLLIWILVITGICVLGCVICCVCCCSAICGKKTYPQGPVVQPGVHPSMYQQFVPNAQVSPQGYPQQFQPMQQPPQPIADSKQPLLQSKDGYQSIE